MTEIEFPMYFSLVPNPGYNISFLDTLGIDGEFHLFIGNFLKDNKTSGNWKWGIVNHTIESNFDSMVICILDQLTIFI